MDDDIFIPYNETMHFADRIDAARKLAPKLSHYKNAQDTYILAIPRGSLQMGYELAKSLNLPLDIVVTKKVPHPQNEEYAIGAIAPDGEVLLNPAEAARTSPAYIEATKEELLEKINRRYHKYRKDIGTPDAGNIPSFKGKTVIIIDDGIATGFTMKAAVLYLQRQQAAKIVVAVPVAAPDSAREIAGMTDEFICLSMPPFFAAVGQFYAEFPQVSDEEAASFLEKAARERA